MVKDGEDAVDVKELVNEMEGEADDPAVSQISRLKTQRRTRLKEEYSVYAVGEDGCGYPFLLGGIAGAGATFTEVLTLLLCGATTGRGGGGACSFHLVPLSSRQPHIPRQRSPLPTSILSFLQLSKDERPLTNAGSSSNQ